MGLPDGSVEQDGGGMQTGTDAGGTTGADAGLDDGGTTGADAGLDDGGTIGSDAGLDDGGTIGSDAGLEDGGTTGSDAGANVLLAVNANFTVDEDSQATGQLSATNDAGLPLTFTLQQAPANGTATVSSTGAFTYAPAANFFGTDTFTFQVGDGASLSVGTVTATVTAINDAPVITAQNALSTLEETGLTLWLADLTITDVDSSTFTLTVGAGSNYAVSGTTVTPAADFNGTLSIPVTVSDGSATSNTFTLSVTVTPVNDAPVITAQNTVSTPEDTARAIAVSDLVITDPDSSTFTLTVGAGSNYTVSGATVTPAANFNGTLTVPVTVTDGSANSNSFALSVTVTAINDAPVITAQGSLSTPEDTAKTVTLADLTFTDVDSTPPPGFSVTLSSGANYTVSGATLTPALNFFGTLSVPVSVSDGTDNSANFVLTVTVTAVADAPVATSDSYTTNGNTLLTVVSPGVLGNDTDAESATSALVVSAFSAVSANNGTVSVAADGSFTYLPAAGAVGTSDSFTYTVRDPTGLTTVGTVTVSTVTPRVWYVDNSRSSGDGRSAFPFPTLASALSASGVGDILFLYAGTSPYPGPVVLKANQRLVGHPAGLTLPISNFSIAPGGRPSITLPSATAPVVQLASASEVTQVSVGVPNGITFSAVNTTGGLVDNVILSAGAIGFQLQAAAGLTVQSVTSNGLLDSVLRVPDDSYVDGLTLRDSTFANVGNAVGDRAFNFGNGSPTGTGPVRGTVLLQRLSVSATGQDGIVVEAGGNTGTLELDDVDLFVPNNAGTGLRARANAVNASPPTLFVTVRNTSLIEVGTGGNAMDLSSSGNGASNLTVVFDNSILRAASGTVPNDGIRATADGVNSLLNLKLLPYCGITNFNGRAIAAAATANGALLQAVIRFAGINAFGATTPLSSGILFETSPGTSSGSIRGSVYSTQIDVNGGPALKARAGGGSVASRLDLEIYNNAFTSRSPTASTLDLGSLNSGLGCQWVSGNISTSSSGTAYRLSEGTSSTMLLEGSSPSATVQLASTNTATGGAAMVVDPGVSLVPVNTCPRPTN